MDLDSLLMSVKDLSHRDMRKLITAYIKEHPDLKDKRFAKLIVKDTEEENKKIVRPTCPKCGSLIIVKDGKRSNGMQRLKCTDCHHRFSYLSNTIFENSRYSWDFFVDLIYLMSMIRRLVIWSRS